MFAQRRKCPLLFALDDAQVMNIRPQIYIKVSFQMEGLGKSIWIPSMTIPSPSELNLRGGASVFIAWSPDWAFLTFYYQVLLHIWDWNQTEQMYDFLCGVCDNAAG